MPYLLISGPVAVSKRPYAIDPKGAVRGAHWWTVLAIWLGRKRRRDTVTIGTLSLYPRRAVPETLADALADADTHHGGNWHAQWDGIQLLVEPRHPLSPTQALRTAGDLDAVRRAVPSLPPGHIGWYYRQSC